MIENGASVGVGFDVSLAQAIADKLGVELVTSEMAFDSLIPAVQAGTVDIAASITPTEERKQAVDFSDNYYDTTNVFVVRKGEEGNFTSKESFDGKTIGAQMGTAQNTLVVEEMTNAQSLLLPKTTTLIQELNTGNIDAICLEKPLRTSMSRPIRTTWRSAPMRFPSRRAAWPSPLPRARRTCLTSSTRSSPR